MNFTPLSFWSKSKHVKYFYVLRYVSQPMPVLIQVRISYSFFDHFYFFPSYLFPFFIEKFVICTFQTRKTMYNLSYIVGCYSIITVYFVSFNYLCMSKYIYLGDPNCTFNKNVYYITTISPFIVTLSSIFKPSPSQLLTEKYKFAASKDGAECIKTKSSRQNARRNNSFQYELLY